MRSYRVPVEDLCVYGPRVIVRGGTYDFAGRIDWTDSRGEAWCHVYFYGTDPMSVPAGTYFEVMDY